MFTTTLITTARVWKPPKCPSTEELIQKMWFLYTTEYSSTKKIIPQYSLILKYNKSDIERQISYDITDVWNLKKKKGTNELIYKTETESQIQKANMVSKFGEG